MIILIGCSDSAEIELIKQGTLNDYPQKTVGDAIDNFFGNSKWSQFKSSEGIIYVDVKGRMKYMEKEVKGHIQFKIHEDGESFEIYSFSMNDIPQINFMLTGLIEKMYED